MKTHLDDQLDILSQHLLEMAMMIENAISSAAKALSERDVELAEKAIAYDSNVDQKEKEIESHCLRMLLQQQPVAGDLRTVSAALKMITDMERIGDQAADLAAIVRQLPVRGDRLPMRHIPEMAQTAVKMVRQSIQAYVGENMELARQVLEMDDIVDGLFIKVRQDLLQTIRSREDSGGEALDLLMAAKYLERIGDHATNIAEWVIFSASGIYKDAPLLGEAQT